VPQNKSDECSSRISNSPALGDGILNWFGGESAGWLRIHILGALGAGIVLLSACSLNPRREAWTSYHVLVAAGSVYAFAFLIAGVIAVRPLLRELLIPRGR
jgi:hypothetical protein